MENKKELTGIIGQNEIVQKMPVKILGENRKKRKTDAVTILKISG